MGFTQTGGEQTYTVPCGVTLAAVKAVAMHRLHYGGDGIGSGSTPMTGPKPKSPRPDRCIAGHSGHPPGRREG